MTSSLIASAMLRDPLYHIECLTAPSYTKYLISSTHALQRLKRLHLHRPRRSGEQFANLSLDLQFARFVVLESVEVSLERNLLSRVTELSVAEPPAVACAPGFALEAQVAAK